MVAVVVVGIFVWTWADEPKPAPSSDFPPFFKFCPKPSNMPSSASLHVQRRKKRPTACPKGVLRKYSLLILCSVWMFSNESSVGLTVSADSTSPRIFQRRRVQIVHRHGDRSPITPLNDETYWEEQLIPSSTMDRISSNTALVEDETCHSRHIANGRGPFGKLTELGLLQMIKLGSKLREMLVEPLENEDVPQPDTENRLVLPYLFDERNNRLDPSKLRILSTNMDRTIQSVRGTLVGLFPDGTDTTIPIDVRNTDWMIPDPNPRRSTEQAPLELRLSQRSHILDKEKQLRSLAETATQALQDLLAEDAVEMSFGTPQPSDNKVDISSDYEYTTTPLLSWNQLAEICGCLAVRDRLPLSPDDHATIRLHTAWRAFQAYSDPRLAQLAMGTLASALLATTYDEDGRPLPPLTIWSAHDSTLIGLLCAFRLEQPVEWPEYGSFFMVELLQEVGIGGSEESWMVRFSLNGEVLRTFWNDAPTDMIALDELRQKMAAPATSAFQ